MSDHADNENNNGQAPPADPDEAETVDGKDVGEHYREMTDLGAHVKGEGEIK